MLENEEAALGGEAPKAAESGRIADKHSSTSDDTTSGVHHQALQQLPRVTDDQGKAAFRSAAERHGLLLPDHIEIDEGPGRYHRCGVEGKGKSRGRDGSYSLYRLTDGSLYGGFQNHTAGRGWQRWRPGRSGGPAPAVDQGKVLAARLADQKRQEVAYSEVAASAACRWGTANPADPRHPYILTKGLASTHGARQSGHNIVLAFGDGNIIATLQTIGPDGSKLWMKGGKKRGSFALIGKLVGTKPIVICEGWATGCSIHEATGLPVVVAGDAGNLLPVAEAIRRRFLRATIIIGADNDGNGVGQRGAKEAARSVGARVVTPPRAGFDFNDLACRDGLASVAAMFGERRQHG